MFDDLRMKIDKIDEELLILLNKRAELSLEAGELKKELSMNGFIPTREEEVLKRLRLLNKGPLSMKMLELNFESILSNSRCLQGEQAISCTKAEETFVKRIFGPFASIIIHDEYHKAFGDLKEGRTQFVCTRLKLDDDLFFVLNHFKPFIYAKYQVKDEWYLIFAKHKNRQSVHIITAYLLENERQLKDEFLQNEEIFCLKGAKFSYLECSSSKEISGLWLGAFELFKKS